MRGIQLASRRESPWTQRTSCARARTAMKARTSLPQTQNGHSRTREAKRESAETSVLGERGRRGQLGAKMYYSAWKRLSAEQRESCEHGQHQWRSNAYEKCRHPLRSIETVDHTASSIFGIFGMTHSINTHSRDIRLSIDLMQSPKSV